MSEESTISGNEHSLDNQKAEEIRLELAECKKILESLWEKKNQIRFETEKRIGKRIITEILPEFRDLDNYIMPEKIRVRLNSIKDRLKLIIPSPENPYSILILLSTRENQIASMIKDGYKSPEIADTLNIDLSTVKTHRKNIRKKLKLTGKDITLEQYIKSLFAD